MGFHYIFDQRAAKYDSSNSILRKRRKLPICKIVFVSCVELSLWNKAKMAVSVLPNEILSYIFGLLNPIDFGKIIMTCNKWRKIAMIPDVFLKQKEKLKRLRKLNVHMWCQYL